VDPMRHAWLARRLIDACGGLSAAEGVCRLAKSRLSEFQQPAGGSFMPADVIHDLEAYCGEPLYSRELVAARPWCAVGEGLAEEASEATEAAARLQGLARKLHGALGRNDREAILACCAEVETHIRVLMAAAVREVAP